MLSRRIAWLVLAAWAAPLLFPDTVAAGAAAATGVLPAPAAAAAGRFAVDPVLASAALAPFLLPLPFVMPLRHLIEAMMHSRIDLGPGRRYRRHMRNLAKRYGAVLVRRGVAMAVGLAALFVAAYGPEDGLLRLAAFPSSLAVIDDAVHEIATRHRLPADPAPTKTGA